MELHHRSTNLGLMFGTTKHKERGAIQGGELETFFVLLPCFAARTVDTKRDLLLRLERHVIGYPHEREWKAIPFKGGRNGLTYIIVVNYTKQRNKPMVMCGCRHKEKSHRFRYFPSSVLPVF